MTTWHIITCEYPPQLGGISHYIYSVSRGLAAAGDEVHVWCPESKEVPQSAPGVTVHAELGGMSPADLRRASRLLNDFPKPRRLFVQWVPHGYGYRSMNLHFCYWLWQRSSYWGDHVEVMAHETYLPFAGGWRQHAVALVHRLMTATILRAPKQVWMSIPAWESYLRPYALGRRLSFLWLPVASNVPEEWDPVATAAVRSSYAGVPGPLLGHYGTFDGSVVRLLRPLLVSLLTKQENLSVLLMGPRGEAIRDEIRDIRPDFRTRVHATGALTVSQSATHLKACDLLLQPYPDGVTSRRTTMMAGLGLKLPIVTTIGQLSESLWVESGAVAWAPVSDVEGIVRRVAGLLGNIQERERLGEAGYRLYQDKFKLQNIVAALRADRTYVNCQHADSNS